MRLNVFFKDRGIYLLRYAFSVAIPPLYVLAVSAGVLTRKLAFLQPLIVGTMPLALQFIALDIIFSFVRSQSGGDKRLAVLIFIAALFFCQFAVHAGWFVFDAVLISAVTVMLSPKGRTPFILRWTILLIFLVLCLS